MTAIADTRRRPRRIFKKLLKRGGARRSSSDHRYWGGRSYRPVECHDCGEWSRVAHRSADLLDLRPGGEIRLGDGGFFEVVYPYPYPRES